MIKLVAFDWNGTLLSDTICCWEGANVQLKFCDCKPMSLLRFRETFEVPVVNSLVANGADREFCQKNKVAVAEAFHTFYEKRAATARTRAGTRDVLKWLHQRKIFSMIYSNHTSSGIESQLNRLKIKHFMDKVLANPAVEGSLHRKKTKGQKLAEYIKGKKLKPLEVISVGDTKEEIEIGKHFGYHTVGITGGYNTTKDLKKVHPDFLIHNMKDLIPIIKKLNK